MKLRIGVVGTGNVGTTLGGRLARKHSVRYGSRDPAQCKHPDLAPLPIPELCDWAEVVVVAVPGFRTATAAAALARSLGPGVGGA
jgi:predicted dinucleotide-binding enzyme